MPDPVATSPSRRLPGLCLWAALAVSAALNVGFDACIVASGQDTEHLESTLTLAAANQFRLGFGSLYGPYSSRNPWVLVQAPLYYRLTAALAWPLIGAGLHPVLASLVAGRVLSSAAFLVTLLAAFRLARLEGGTLRAGAWSALLVAASSVVGSYPVTVRPDMLGVCLQTLGVLGVIRAWLEPSPRPRGLGASYVAFALAFCVKQHDVMALAVSSMFLLARAVRRPEWRVPVLAAHGLWIVGVAAVLGVEELVSVGRMSRMAFVMPLMFGRITGTSWLWPLALVGRTAEHSIGLIALGAAALPARTPGSTPGRLDRMLLAYLAAEVLALVVLAHGSSGAWLNYALQGIVFASLLVGRGLDRALAAGSRGRVALVVLAAAVLVMATGWNTYTRIRQRAAADRSMLALLAVPELRESSRAEVYFVALPEYNRTLGRLDLALDDWLYNSLEQAGAAEPRAGWLHRLLSEGPVRVVIVPRDPPIPISDLAVVPGLHAPLPALGYVSLGTHGRFVVWARRGPAGAGRPGSQGPGLIVPPRPGPFRPGAR